ncbi:MAG: hypothetical protein C4528_01260 [Gammaproteobacteria bacterium]|nr:MAG: hypothetical protein C4528_01260 [Gammaproteobacteria bacterium]
MSLINQVLRDLESGRPRGPAANALGDLRPAQSPSPSSMLRQVNWRRLAAIVSGFALLLGGYLWYARMNPAPPPLTFSVAPAVTPAVAPQTGGGGTPEAPPAQTGVAASVATQGAQAPSMDTPPPVPEAVTSEVPVSAPGAAPPVEALPPQQDAGQQDAGKKTDADVAAQTAGNEQAQRAPTPPAAQPPARVQDSTPAGRPPRIKKPSVQGPSQLAERNYQEAVEALQNGKVADARQRLREALAQQPRHHQSRELLAEIYLRGGQTGEAESLLAAGAALDPGHTLFSKLHARLLAQRGDISGALRVLERYPADAAGDPEHHALLGALYQRAGNHAQAISAYRAALRLQSNQGQWWMGLAISLEAEQNPGEALSAYRRAQSSGALTGAALDFVQRKITRLEASAS